MKIIDVITLTATATLFGVVTAANLLQPNRPTVSETEQRPLASVPAFTAAALADGSYFSGWSSFFSDTFLGRDMLVNAAKEFDTLMGIPYSMGDGDRFAVLQPGGAQNNTDEPDDNAQDLLADAFAQLTGAVTETESVDTVLPNVEPSETESPVTESLDTEPADTETPEAGTETEAETEVETDAETEMPQDTVVLKLSRDTLRLTVGSGTVLYAMVETAGEEVSSVLWYNSDKTVAAVTKNPAGGIDVKGIAEGECTLTCRTESGAEAKCTVTVTTVEASAKTNDGSADFLTSGLFIYGDAVYTPAYYGEKSATYYAQTAAYYQSLFGPDVQVSVVMAPVSSMVIDNPEVKARVSDQGEIQKKVAALMDQNVNFVDVYSEMYDHKDEYLFFKSDHHWTARGAYYAYRAFAESRGFTPTELSDFDYKLITDYYNGSMYALTKDSRVKEFVDTVEAWMSKKKMTMTVTNLSGTTAAYDNCILPAYGNYISFIAGDNPYTVINVPENPQDRNILVLKDSFGNAFVPFLAEHYGNIIVVDVRHTSMNVYEQLKDYGLTDILFVNNVQAAMSSSWPRMYLEAVGVKSE